MKTHLLAGFAVALAVAAIGAQTAPPTDSWPTYNGDFSGRRFSPLTKIHAGNVNALDARLDVPGERERRLEQQHQEHAAHDR